MTTDLLHTKFQIPPLRAALISRPRLLALLDEALPQDGVWRRKLTLVSAPAGYGKTTLLSAWCAWLPHPVAWLTLDRDDNDPIRFLAYLVAALQTIVPHLGAELQAGLGNRAAAPRGLLFSLANEITATAPPFALVLDDYHLIQEATIHDLVTFLLEQQPPQMHLVIATRADPPLPLPRLRGQGMLAEVRLQALRFTVQEATSFLGETMALGLTSGEVATLTSRTEGWIAGLHLAALALRGRHEKEAAEFVAGFSGTHRYVLDYLLEEVLQRQPEEVEQFLLRTSILDRLVAPLCDFLLSDFHDPQSPVPEPKAQQTLSYLDAHNLFLVPLDEQRCWYRYHHLFATLLRSRLQATRPEEVSHLHERASHWFERAGRIDEALTHVLAAGDSGRAALLVEQNALHLIHTAQPAVLSRWIRALPAGRVVTRPWLAVFAAWSSYWDGARDEVEHYLQLVETLLAEKPWAGPAEQDEILAHVALLRAHLAIQEEDVPAIVLMGQRAGALAPAAGPGAGYLAWLVPLVQGVAAWGLGDVREAAAAFHRARLAALKEGRLEEAIIPACYESLQQIRQGRLTEATASLEEILRLATGGGAPETPAAGFAYLRLGDIAREQNQLEQARRFLQEGVVLCEEWGVADVVVDGYVMLARLHFACGETTEMRQALVRAGEHRRTAQIDPFVCTWLDRCRLRLWIYEGEFAAVRRWLARNGPGPDTPLRYLRDLDHINLALALVALARHEADRVCLDEALQLLSRLLEATERAGWVQEQIQLLLLQAIALESGGEPGSADGAMARALKLAEPGGYVRCFLDEGGTQPGDRPLLPLLYRALKQGVLPGYASHLLRQSPERAAPGPLAETGTGLVEPLSERELDVLRLIAAGLSNREIGLQLSISLPTVKWHASNLYGKLGASNRTEAVAVARALELLP